MYVRMNPLHLAAAMVGLGGDLIQPLRRMLVAISSQGMSRSRPSGLLVANLLLALAGCAADAPPAPSNPYYDPSKPHHTPSGFKNNYLPEGGKTYSDLLRWNWEAWRQGLPLAPTQATPRQAPDLNLIAANSQAREAGKPSALPAITWLGHASMVVQAGRLNVLVDPMFSERASPFAFMGPRRAHPPGLALAQLPPIDVVLISHNHYDHLDEPSVKALAERGRTQGAEPLFIVPLGLKPWLTARGITRVVELDWWQQHPHAGTSFYLTPAQHWSARSFGDRSETLWGGFAVFAPDFHWFYSGDTGYSKDFVDIRQRFKEPVAAGGKGAAWSGFDLAMIPVGAYEPRWFMQEQHVNPAEALQIHRDLGVRQSVGVHWGVFAMTDEALDQPPKDLAAARQAAGMSEDEFFLMRLGETRQFTARSAP